MDPFDMTNVRYIADLPKSNEPFYAIFVQGRNEQESGYVNWHLEVETYKTQKAWEEGIRKHVDYKSSFYPVKIAPAKVNLTVNIEHPKL